MLCYYCGKKIINEKPTREHIPAKNLFEGLDEQFKMNLITVPAHFSCNNKFSKIDHHLRDMVGISNDSLTDKQTISAKAAKSILRHPKGINRIEFDATGEITGVSFGRTEIEEFHLKNFRGIFYYTNGFPLPEDFEVEVLTSDGDEITKMDRIFFEFLTSGDPEWQHSGHEDVFRFLLRYLQSDENGQMAITTDLDRALIVGVVMFYHNTFGAVAIADRSGFFKGLKQTNSQITQ